MAENLVITIVHQLPGRFRLRLSDPPERPGDTAGRVRAHEGIIAMEYNGISRSMLVRFNPLEVSREEIILRIAYDLSLEYDRIPVRILVEPESREVSDSAFYSALTIVVALAARGMTANPRTRLALDWTAALGTAGAVVIHGWDDMRRRGYFDPEVLSVVYLGASMVRGSFLPATVVTWLTTFGRHLLAPVPQGVRLRLVESIENGNDMEPFSIVVEPDHDGRNTAGFLSFIPAVVQYAIIGGSGLGASGLLMDIRDVAGVHNDVLEGLGNQQYGIPIRVNRP
ncbi:hypothetical protein ACFL2Q_00855 [Thermodesulfobacteriota bacterium]